MPEREGKAPEQNLTWFVSGFVTVQERRKTASSLLSGKKPGYYEDIRQKPFTLARKTGSLPALKGSFHGFAKGIKESPLFPKKQVQRKVLEHFPRYLTELLPLLLATIPFSSLLHCYKT